MSEVQQPDQHPQPAATAMRRRSLFGAAAATAGVVVAGQAPATAGRGPSGHTQGRDVLRGFR